VDIFPCSTLYLISILFFKNKLCVKTWQVFKLGIVYFSIRLKEHKYLATNT